MDHASILATRRARAAGAKGLREQASRPTKARTLRKCARWSTLIVAFLPATLLLSGCTPWRDYLHNGFKVGPEYQRPAAPVAQDWIDADDQRLRGPTDIQAQWWTAFHDPVLDDLIAATYAQNLTLREAGFRILQARATRGIAVGGLFPQQQYLGVQYTRSVLSQTVLGLGAFFPKRFFSEWDAGFNLAWELDFWGRYRRAIEAADADLEASVENYDDVLVTLLADTATAYVNMRILQRQIELVRANIVLQQETLRIATAKFDGGLTSKLDVDQAQSNLSQTQSLVPQLEIELRQASDQLCILLGIPPEELTRRLPPRPIPTAPPDVAVGIPAELLARRPDVRRAERLAAAQSAEIGVAVSDLYPQIAVTGAIGVDSRDVRTLFRQNSLAGTIGPSLQWNLLNYGRLLNNIRVQDAKFQELVASYQNTVLRANAEVEDGLALFFKSQAQTRYLAESVVAAEDAVRIVKTQYEGGLTDFNRVAVIEQNLVQYQDQHAQAQGNIALGLIETYRALGGGWQIRLAPPTGSFPPARPGDVRPEGEPVPPPGVLPLPGPIPDPPPMDGQGAGLKLKVPHSLGQQLPPAHQLRRIDNRPSEPWRRSSPVRLVAYDQEAAVLWPIERLPRPQRALPEPTAASGDR